MTSVEMASVHHSLAESVQSNAIEVIVVVDDEKFEMLPTSDVDLLFIM